MIAFHELDAWTLRVPVTDESGAAIQLTGATAVALARIGGGAVVALPASVAGGEIVVEIAQGTLPAGTGAIEVRVSRPGQGTQTATDRLEIRRSMQAA